MTTDDEYLVNTLIATIEEDDPVGIKKEWTDDNTITLKIGEIDGPTEIDGKELKRIIIEFVKYDDEEDEEDNEEDE